MSSWDEPKWFKGTRKAIGRTPHMLVGHKSVEDPDIVVWTRNMSEASTGLNSIGVAAEQLANRWASVVKRLRTTVDTFVPLYTPIDDPDSAFKGVETPARTIERAKAVSQALSHLESETNVHAHEMSSKVKYAVDQAKQEVKNVSQLLTKRHHKKIDFDRTVQSLAHQAGKNGSPFDAENTETEEQRLFEVYDERVRTIVPKFLVEIDVVLKRLTLLVNTYMIRFYESFAKNLETAADAAGITNTTVQVAISEWQAEFSAIKPAVEALSFCQGGRNEIPSRLDDRHVPGSGHISESFVGRAFNKVAQNVVMPRFVGGMGLFGDEHALEKEEADKATKGEGEPASTESSAEPQGAHDQWVESLYPYKGDDGDLSFAAGEKILIVDRGIEGDPNWWLGKKVSDGSQGLFPKNYVKATEPPQPPRKKVERPLPTPPGADEPAGTPVVSSEVVDDLKAAAATEEAKTVPEPLPKAVPEPLPKAVPAETIPEPLPKVAEPVAIPAPPPKVSAPEPLSAKIESDPLSEAAKTGSAPGGAPVSETIAPAAGEHATPVIPLAPVVQEAAPVEEAKVATPAVVETVKEVPAEGPAEAAIETVKETVLPKPVVAETVVAEPIEVEEPAAVKEAEAAKKDAADATDDLL